MTSLLYALTLDAIHIPFSYRVVHTGHGWTDATSRPGVLLCASRKGRIQCSTFVGWYVAARCLRHVYEKSSTGNFSVSVRWFCVCEVILCVCEVILCACEVILCVCEVILCACEVILCACEVILCACEVIFCACEVILCACEVIRPATSERRLNTNITERPWE